jgi:type IV pilus assembly protein PilA
MRNMQKGFTLIELMIVVAIIGILAAIAIPQYQDYITRAKWQDNISRVQSYKTAIAECLQNNNGFITLCDTTDKISATTGAVPPPAGGNLSAFTQTGTTGALVLTGTASVGECVVTITPSAGTTSVTWGYTNSGTGCGKSKTGVGT